MKHIIFSFVILITLAFSVQNVIGQSVAVRGGFTFPNLQMEDNFSSFEENSSITGFNVGILYEQHLLDFFGIETGVVLNTRGAINNNLKIDFVVPQDLEGTIRTLFVELPLHLKLTIPIEPVRLSFFAGPTVSVGISGTQLIHGTYNGEKIHSEQDIRWGSSPNTYQRIDIGLNGGVTMEIHRVQVGLSYYIGLRNLSNETTTNLTLYNRALQLSAGYRFML